MALKIFTNDYTRGFMHQLVSGQVDVDRLDYLKRDSFYTGVTEGNINTDRILSVMNVKNEQLVFESKGIHSLEKFLLARRLMYWQVYLHKTSLVAELVLVKVLTRFRMMIKSGNQKIEPSHILYPFFNSSKSEKLKNNILDYYLKLDNTDILFLLKSWMSNEDIVLRKLSTQLIQRELPKIEIKENPFDLSEIKKLKKKLISLTSSDDLNYFVFTGDISNQMYNADHTKILLKEKSGKIVPLESLINYLDFKQFSTPFHKYYLCHPKSISSL